MEKKKIQIQSYQNKNQNETKIKERFGKKVNLSNSTQPHIILRAVLTRQNQETRALRFFDNLGMRSCLIDRFPKYAGGFDGSREGSSRMHRVSRSSISLWANRMLGWRMETACGISSWLTSLCLRTSICRLPRKLTRAFTFFSFLLAFEYTCDVISWSQ